jgi:hypothetical protein
MRNQFEDEEDVRTYITMLVNQIDEVTNYREERQS